MNMLLVVLALCAISLFLVALIGFHRGRYFSHREKKGEYVHGAVFSFLTSLYAFFIGFSIVTLWSTFNEAKNIVIDESNSLLIASRLSENLPGSNGFRRAVADYVTSVIETEWPRMDDQNRMSQETTALFGGVWDGYLSLRPSDPTFLSLYANLHVPLAKAAEKRQARSLLLSDNLYPLVWVILGAGFLALVAGLWLTNVDNRRGRFILEFFVIFLVLSCIYLIYDISTPFSGNVNVSFAAFQEVLNHVAPTVR